MEFLLYLCWTLFTNKFYTIMKNVKCKLIFHGSYKQHDMGVFESISAAKKYVAQCSNIWTRPYTIVRIKE